MKNYTIIPNYASGKFSPNDLYTITGIYLTANDSISQIQPMNK